MHKKIILLEASIMECFNKAWLGNRPFEISDELIKSFLIEHKFAISPSKSNFCFWKENKNVAEEFLKSNFLEVEIEVLEKENYNKYLFLKLLKEKLISTITCYILYDPSDFEYHDEFEFSGAVNTKFNNIIPIASIFYR